MPGYINDMLTRFHHKRPKGRQNSPHQHIAPNYWARSQYAEPENPGHLLDKVEKTYVQAVTGTLLYYAREVDSTILTKLNAIATQQAAPTESTMEEIKQLLDYCASQEEAIVTYHTSDMILVVRSNASYFNECKLQSRAGGAFLFIKPCTIPA